MPLLNPSMPKSRLSEVSSEESLIFLSSCSDWLNCARNTGTGDERNRIFGLTRNCAVITAPKASFPDAQTAQKKNGNKSVYKSEP